ncbi:hypothetical protein BOTCAL_0202g00090 [Botryotinia calthae]|uniref:Uncharacterized protein n=1 Tax=Botryotinia calthae TaxID=38488 RepID=A0A4Y8CZF5_9HELO|nr:hypothetical protein BOTCAL_0202g00090 [Botryotinia calthae]
MTIPTTNIPMDETTARSDEKEANGTSQPFTNRKSIDGPLLLTLLMGNNNNNAWAMAQSASYAVSDTLNPNYCALELSSTGNDNEEGIDNDPSPIDGEDGPFLLTPVPNKSPTKAFSAIPDTLHPRSATLELKPALVDNEVGFNESSAEVGSDGPILFALLLNNQNNNNNKNQVPDTISDTLDPRSVTLELKSPVDTPKDISANDTDQFISEGDGPLLLTMLLANQNQNNGNAVNKAAEKVIADTLDPSDTITEAISDVLEMKPQLLELHSPGNDDTNSIPVILKVNSQAQKAQILAMLQGRSIPVSIASNGTKGNYANQTLDRAQVSAANLQSAPHVALNEAQNGKLSDEQLQFWRENGYLVIPDILSDSQKDHLLKTVHEAAQVLAGGGERVQKHSYLPGQKSYVSPVGRAIATLSEHGFNPEVEPLKRIQRIGCGIHRVMPPFRKAILSPFHSTLAKSLGYKEPRIYQSLIIVKAAEVGARVVPHQDGCSGFTNPSSCTTFWYALEDCSTENGCLAVAPGSHRVQPITRRCINNANGQPVFTDLEEPIYANIEGVDDSTLPKKNEKGGFEYKNLEVKAGTLILMHGNLMHTSEANQSSKSRVAFNFGVVEGEHGWLEDNYLQPYEGTTEFEKL